ncbi:MAG: 4-alpha-glucanotransferase [Calditrichia bacterium]
MKRRGCGVLMHISSLPSRFGIGDMGPEAYRFVDFLYETKQIFWQVLPLNPTSAISGNSPYASPSAFAGNKLFISPELLLRMDLLSRDDLNTYPQLPDENVDYSGVIAAKAKLFHLAYQKFKDDRDRYRYDYERFINEHANWLEPYAAFIAFKQHFNDSVWSDWPQEIRDRNKTALDRLKAELAEKIEYEKFIQFLFFKQWTLLKNYCNEHGIQIIGDIPYYVNYDSADVWTHPEIFKLDAQKEPTHVAGVPPDYFSETGQLWGNPVYRWDVLKAAGYDWWIQRVVHNLKLYDIARIDHFRGFLAYWEVPASETTAINGEWVQAPADDFFNTLLQRFTNLPILAEDLGVITPDVRELMQKYDLPGMRLLVFAFDESLPNNSYAPHNHVKDCVVYTGTHDNNTVIGWFKQEVDDAMKERLFTYLGWEVPEEKIHWALIRLALMSVANLVILPMQDILGLDSEHRMNRPATLNGNWKWRLKPEQIQPEITASLKRLVEMYGRA